MRKFVICLELSISSDKHIDEEVDAAFHWFEVSSHGLWEFYPKVGGKLDIRHKILLRPCWVDTSVQ
jgi:hypothetical protein